MNKMARDDALKSKFLLSEVEDYSAINVPLKTTGRIKYTCFDVSQSFLVFGATSGGLYVFKREPCTFIQLLPNKEGPITSILISPDEKLFAFSSQRGVVCVLERTEGVSTRLLNRSTEHSGTRVTALQWANTSDQIFIGDSVGRLSVINVSLFMSKNIFQIPSFIFMQLDSGVVQISCHDDRLLISTLTHCYVCDTAKEQYRQIGTKPRDGEYGACYLDDKIFCARPGSRLWEVDLEGTVQSTHQFKKLLAVKPSLVVTDDRLFNNVVSDERHCWDEQSFNFIRLSPILKFLFTFKNDGIYIFDPEKVSVVLWSNHFKDIIDAKCLDNHIYIWTCSKNLYTLSVITLDKCLLRLFFREKYNVCKELLTYFLEELLESKEFLLKLNPLIDLKNYVTCNDDIIKLLNEIESVASQKEKATRLESGIFMLDNHHVCQKLLLESNRDYKTLNSSSSENNISVIDDKQCGSPSLLESQISLPELVRSSGQINLIGSNSNNDSKNTVNGVCSVPQIPFLPLSSPDVIHDALLEIGCNVSDKITTSKKTLKDKWQILEGKLKLSSKVENTRTAFDFKSSDDNVDDDFSKQMIDGDSIKDEGDDYDEPVIVSNKTDYGNKTNQQKFIAADLINICCELDKLENERRISMLNEFLSCVLITYKKYNDFLVGNNNFMLSTSSAINTTGTGQIKYFPFHRYLPKNYVLMIKQLFHDSLKTNELLHRLNINNRQSNSVLCNELFKHCAIMKKKHPTILSDVYSSDILNFDLMLSILLIIFSEILDPYMILQDLNSVDLPCMYLSWCVIIERFQDGALHYFSQGNINNRDHKGVVKEHNGKNYEEDLNVGCKEWPLPLLLNAMFLLLRLDQVQAAVKMGEGGHVSLSTVSYILLKLSSDLEESGMTKYDADKKCANLFLLYLSKAITSKHNNIDFDNQGLLMHIEESFIIINKDLRYSVCHCGFPKVNILNRSVQNNYHKVVKYHNIAEILLNYYWDNRVKPDILSHMPLSNEQNDENFWSLLGSMDEGHIQGNDCLEHIKRLCCVAPPLLLWLLKNKLKQDLFTVRTVLVLQLGYLHELDVNNTIGIDKWEQIIGLNCRIERGECCFCNRKCEPIPGINWSQLVVLILRTIGPRASLMILKKFIGELTHGIINKRFYQACVLSSYIESRSNSDNKKEVVINAINCITNDSNYISSTAVASKDCKGGIDLAHAVSIDVVTEPDRVLSKILSVDNHHWGTAVDLQSGCCGLCSLSLSAPCLLLDTGLRAFKCGHAFHFVCLNIKQTLKLCPICTSFSSNNRCI
ncbi:WD40 repeat domain-containing protein pink isoform X2 [Lycorma delicatula]|uniref:WD40 repeat domain-containing protein pink isoform X2 n=1 Tax=Lycorma delicatula TaxID=130591 RepID=UPI003F5188C9